MVGDSSDDSAVIPTSPSSDGAAGAGVGQTALAGEAALDLGYTVTVDSFSGPLDLLLYLVRRTELDILEVPLSLIVDQFVDTVRSWQDADLDVAGEFILMAATLLELKARTIAPPLDQPEEGAEDEPMFDPRESLLRSLLAYRRFKEAAQGLGELEEARRPLLERQVREHIPEAPPEEGDFDLGEIDLSLLATTCERILSRIGGLGPRTVVVDEMPLGVRIASMLDELAVRERTTISELLAGNHSRVVHITTVMATLELARQRFIEVEQPEQFGEIALRLRSNEEREHTPELPPPEPEGPKRRRKLPLVTFTAPPSATPNDDDGVEAEAEDLSETDEQRFLRELEEATRVTAVLAITANVEKSFTEHWYALHPELKPVAPPPAAVPEPVVKRFPLRRPSPAPATPANEAPAVPTADTPAASTADTPAAPIADTPVAPTTDTPAAPTSATPEGAVPAAAAEMVTVTPATTPVPVAEVVAETPVLTELAMVAPASAEPVTPATESATVTTSPVADAVSTAESPTSTTTVVPAVAETSVAALADPISAVPEPAGAASSAALVESPTSDVPATTTTNDIPASPEQRVLPVEQWPVMHALPAAEEAPHPLDTITSDDPAAVNALLSGEAPRPARRAQDDDEEDEADEDEDPDELLADDPALVNAALQADSPRFPVERTPVPELIIPTATDTSVWTAPIDRGQTVAEVTDDLVPPSAESASPNEPAAELSSLVDEAMTVDRAVGEQPLVENAVETQATEVASASEVASAALDEELEPDEQNDVADPALVDAALQADSPRPSITLHPVHELTIPVATETSVWTAPVDRGQTAAEVEDEVADEPEASADFPANDASVVAATDEPEVAAASAPATPPVDEVITADVVPDVAPDVEAPASPAAVSEPSLSEPSLSEPPPVTTPLVVPEPATASSTSGAPTAVEVVIAAAVGTPTTVVDDRAAAGDPPPPEDGPPVAAPPRPAAPPPPPPRSDSPLPAPTTTPTPKRPMSPPPRSKAWLLIAIFIAINVGWAGVMWLNSVPREVLEVAATEQGGDAEHPTLVWRFNLDVVDAVAQAKPPELVPVITPALSGRWVWSDPRTLVFEAAAPLPLATTFTATLPVDDFRTVHGFRLRAPAVQTWSTPALAISGAAVETFDREGTTIALTFTQPVDPLAIVRQLVIEWPAGDVVTTTTPVVAPTPPAAVPPVTSTNDPAATLTDSAPVAVAPVVDAPLAPAVADQSATRTPSVSVAVKFVDVTSESLGDLGITALPAVATATSEIPTSAPVLQVRAITTEPATTIRLVLAGRTRGRVTLRLPVGTTGVAGPLGLAQAWEQQVALQQTLHLTSGAAVVPSHGDVRIDVAVSDPAAPRELLAPVVSVDPAVPVTVSTTDTGLSLVGAFEPGKSYRIAVSATWPDDPATSGHVLSAYTAASDISVAIPARPAGIWPLDTEVVDGHQRLAAHLVDRADVLLLRASDEECVASREVVWSGAEPAVLDLADLTGQQPAELYKVRVQTPDGSSVRSEQALVIEHVRVRPDDLLTAMSDWLLASLAGEEHIDVRVRVLRLR